MAILDGMFVSPRPTPRFLCGNLTPRWHEAVLGVWGEPPALSHGEKTSVRTQKRARQTRLGQPLGLGLPASRTGRNKGVPFKSPKLRYPVRAAQTDSDNGKRWKRNAYFHDHIGTFFFYLDAQEDSGERGEVERKY